MNEVQGVPFQGVEALTWQRGAYYIERDKFYDYSHLIDENYSTPSGHTLGLGTFEPNVRPEAEYQVEDPMKVFEALARAGKPYGLRAFKSPIRAFRGPLDGVLVAGEARDDKLIQFIKDYGIPFRDVRLKYSANSFREALEVRTHAGIGPEDARIGADLRTMAATAYLCWSLRNLLRRMDEGNEPTKIKAREILKRRLHSVRGTYWTFLPAHNTLSWGNFSSTDATAEEITIRKGVYTTCNTFAQVHLANSIKIKLISLDGGASPPRMVVSTNGLVSYLWLHFIASFTQSGLPTYYKTQCQRDEGAYGCGRQFYSESPRINQYCGECERLINRIEQRIKRHPELKGRKEELIKNERKKTSPE